MIKDYSNLTMTIAVCLWAAANSPAELLVELDASNNPGPTGTWATAIGSAESGRYEAESLPPQPALFSDGSGVVFFSTSPLNGGNGWFGGDHSGGTQQAPTGFEPPFSLNGTNPGDFTLELWLRKRGNRIGSDATIFGMKSADTSERIILFLYDGGTGDDEARIDVNLRDTGGTSSNIFDIVLISNKGGNGAFDQLAFTWDNSAALLNVFLNAIQVATNIPVPGVSLSSSTVFNGTTVFESSANDATGNSRFNGDIARVRIYDEILLLAGVQSNFFLGPNGVTSAPVVVDSVVFADSACIQFESEVGVEYDLEFTTDLVNSSLWQNTGAFLEGTGGTLTFYDPTGSSTTRAYRIRSQL